MDWFAKDIKDNSLKRKLSERPLTDTICNFLQIVWHNKMRSIISLFIFLTIVLLISFKLTNDIPDSNDGSTNRNVPWILRQKKDKDYFDKRRELCENFKLKNHVDFRGIPLELSIITVLPTRNDEEMYNIFQSTLLAMEEYIFKNPANLELIIVEWGADQTFKRKLDIPCTFAKVSRIFIGNWLIDTFKRRSEKQQLWEIQMATNIGEKKKK